MAASIQSISTNTFTFNTFRPSFVLDCVSDSQISPPGLRDSPRSARSTVVLLQNFRFQSRISLFLSRRLRSEASTMPEEIIWTASLLKDATNKVTKDNQFEWKLRGFTTSYKHYWNGQVSCWPTPTIQRHSQALLVRIEVYRPKRGEWENSTIRDDYDFERGEPPSGKVITSTWSFHLGRSHAFQPVVGAGRTYRYAGIIIRRVKVWMKMNKLRNGI